MKKDQPNKKVDYIVREFNNYESAHKERFDTCRKILDHWYVKEPTRDYDWQNRVCVPVIVEGEQTVTPRLFSAVFPTSAPVDGEPGINLGETEANVLVQYIRDKFRKAKVRASSIPAFSQCGLFGTGYLEVPYENIYKWTGKTASIEGGMTKCYAVNFFDVFPHPDKISVDDTFPMIRRRVVDATQIKRLVKNSDISSDLLKKALNSTFPEGNDPSSSIKRYEVLEWWGPWSNAFLKDEEEIDMAPPWWSVIINREVLLIDVPNPYKHGRPPYVKFKMYVAPEPSWFGVGVGTIGLPSQERVNKIVNQRLDNVDLILGGGGLYNAHDMVLAKHIASLQSSGPRKWTPATDINNAIRPHDIVDVTASSYNEEKIAKDDFRESTGATTHLMPTDNPQHRTASGISMLQGAAGERLKPVALMIEDDFIAEIASMMLINSSQFQKQPEKLRVEILNEFGEVVGKEVVDVTPDLLQSNILFIPTGTSLTIEKTSDIENLLNFKKLTQDDPTVNRIEINRRIAALLNIKKIEKLLVPQDVGRPGTLQPEDMAKIRQRIAEGATPEQIKQEMLGNPPQMDPEMDGQMMGGEDVIPEGAE